MTMTMTKTMTKSSYDDKDETMTITITKTITMTITKTKCSNDNEDEDEDEDENETMTMTKTMTMTVATFLSFLLSLLFGALLRLFSDLRNHSFLHLNILFYGIRGAVFLLHRQSLTLYPGNGRIPHQMVLRIVFGHKYLSSQTKAFRSFAYIRERRMPLRPATLDIP